MAQSMAATFERLKFDWTARVNFHQKNREGRKRLRRIHPFNKTALRLMPDTLIRLQIPADNTKDSCVYKGSFLLFVSSFNDFVH